MTKISKTSPIDILPTVARTNSRTSTPSDKLTQKPSSTLDMSQLKEKIRLLLVAGHDEPPEKLREQVIKEIVQWQFGGSNFSKPQFKAAYSKLLATLEDSDSYQKLLDTFVNQ